ncbi:MAG: hypothetical protein ABJL99_00040 [Aliishimia sp.]
MPDLMIDRQSNTDTVKEPETFLAVGIGVFHLLRLGETNGNCCEGMDA